MDWKSMTMPASLPITTDFFPEKRSLNIDYVFSDYKIEPEAVNAEVGMRYRVKHFPIKIMFCKKKKKKKKNILCLLVWFKKQEKELSVINNWPTDSVNLSSVKPAT